MREPFPPITINFAPVKVIGIPGLSLVAIAVAIAVEFPEGRWLLLSGVGGGVLVAALLILVRRRDVKTSDGGPGGRPMACDLPSTGQDASSFPRRSANGRVSRPDPSSTSPKTISVSGFNGWRSAPSS
jgi:hypothetical protein